MLFSQLFYEPNFQQPFESYCYQSYEPYYYDEYKQSQSPFQQFVQPYITPHSFGKTYLEELVR